MFTLSEQYHANFVFALIAAAALLMASNRVRYDMIAICVVLALILTNILPVNAALAGFGNSVVILIAGLLVVGEMLDRTGVARFVGNWISQNSSSSTTKMLIMLMLASAILSAVMSSTAVVAIFIPIVLRIAKYSNNSPSKLLLPMSYAALVSGMLTLIATPPNLVVSAGLKSQGFEPLSFFSFTLPGLIVLAGLVLYMVSYGRKWLPDGAPSGEESKSRSVQALWDEYRVEKELTYLRVAIGSPLHGKTIGESELYKKYGIRILDLSQRVRGWRELKAGVSPDIVLHIDDILHVAIPPACTEQVKEELNLVEFKTN